MKSQTLDSDVGEVLSELIVLDKCWKNIRGQDIRLLRQFMRANPNVDYAAEATAFKSFWNTRSEKPEDPVLAFVGCLQCLHSGHVATLNGCAVRVDDEPVGMHSAMCLWYSRRADGSQAP